LRFLFASAWKDLRRRLADPLALGIWIGLPLLLGVLISLANGSGDAVPTARVMLVNEDDSDVSEMIVGALTSGGRSEQVVIEFEEVDRATGEERIGDGDATALLILPSGFADGLLEDQPVTLTLITNPAETILPDIVVEGLEIVREGAFYAQRVLGEPLRTIAAGPGPGQDFFESAAVATLAVQINDRIVAASRLLDPPIIELDLDAGADGAPNADGDADNGIVSVFELASFLLPGMLLMSLLFIAQGMSDDVWTEKENGTLRRAFRAPASLAVFVGGKLVAALVLIACVSAIALFASAFYFKLDFARLPLAIVWCAFTGAGLFCLFLLLGMFATSRRTANLVTMMVLFPLMMMGGSFFPLEMLPPWMGTAGAWTPNGLALVQLREIVLGSPEPRALAIAAAAIAGIGLVSLWLCVLRARRFVTS
jgi:ABC-type multidrug transport system permease subunit